MEGTQAENYAVAGVEPGTPVLNPEAIIARFNDRTEYANELINWVCRNEDYASLPKLKRHLEALRQVANERFHLHAAIAGEKYGSFSSGYYRLLRALIERTAEQTGGQFRRAADRHETADLQVVKFAHGSKNNGQHDRVLTADMRIMAVWEWEHAVELALRGKKRVAGLSYERAKWEAEDRRR